MNIEVFIKRKSCLVIESPLRLRFTKLNHDFTGLGVKQGLSRSTGRFYLIYVASKTKTLCEQLKKSFKFSFLLSGYIPTPPSSRPVFPKVQVYGKFLQRVSREGLVGWE